LGGYIGSSLAMETPRSGYRREAQMASSKSKNCFEVELPQGGHNQSLQQTAAAMLVSHRFTALSAAAAAELCR
jgi:hypothetical protein